MGFVSSQFVVELIDSPDLDCKRSEGTYCTAPGSNIFVTRGDAAYGSLYEVILSPPIHTTAKLLDI